MKNTAVIPLKENRIHGTATFPCAYYWADSRTRAKSVPFYSKHHWHDELEIIYFEKGAYHLEINMEKYDFSEECFCFIGSGELHSIYCENEFLESAVVFSPAMLSFSMEDPAQTQYILPLINGRLALPRFISKNQLCFSNIKQAYQCISESFLLENTNYLTCEQRILNSPAKQLRIKAALMEVLALLAESGCLSSLVPPSDHRIELVKNSLSYMREHYREKIYIKTLAEQVNMNEQYFCRFFKKIIGKSPMEYLNEMRIKQAQTMLRDTDLSVMEICLECGFNNLGNFMRTFKKINDITPLQYRKSVRSM